MMQLKKITTTQKKHHMKVFYGQSKRFDSESQRFRITYKTKSQEQWPVIHAKEDK